MTSLYGKHFASMYTGSMCGAGSHVFAVWGYVIAHTVDGVVEINPALVAFQLGETSERVAAAIAYLCSPDPASRNREFDGRRMVHQGAFSYLVVSHSSYRGIVSSSDLREYNRVKQRESRAKRKAVGDVKNVKTDVNDMSMLSASVSASGICSDPDPDPDLPNRSDQARPDGISGQNKRSSATAPGCHASASEPEHGVPEPRTHETAPTGQPASLARRSEDYLANECSERLEQGPAEKWPEVLEVFKHWEHVWKSKVSVRSGLRDLRLRVVLERFVDGYGVSELCAAITGAHADEFTRDNRNASRLESVLKEPSRVDKFIDFAVAPPVPNHGKAQRGHPEPQPNGKNRLNFNVVKSGG